MPRKVTQARAPFCREVAELQRQGAKAAARGETAAENPLRLAENAPANTGECVDAWSAREAAWQQGHAAQSAVRRQDDDGS